MGLYALLRTKNFGKLAHMAAEGCLNRPLPVWLAKQVAAGEIQPDDIDEKMLEKSLFTEDQPPVDLILRPSGEYRLSNFLIWQSAYAEFVFMDVLWPDFTKEHLEEALEEYSKRNRRFGGV